MLFWKTDICEKDEFHTWFPQLPLSEAQCVWIAMEEHFLSQYDYFLRVWPEWYSSGIWAPPYPGSRVAGGMVDYRNLPLSAGLVERFKTWQAEFDEVHPGDPVSDSEGFTQRAEELARDLKRHVGPRIYVEFYELILSFVIRSECLQGLLFQRTRFWTTTRITGANGLTIARDRRNAAGPESVDLSVDCPGRDQQ